MGYLYDTVKTHILESCEIVLEKNPAANLATIIKIVVLEVKNNTDLVGDSIGTQKILDQQVILLNTSFKELTKRISTEQEILLKRVHQLERTSMNPSQPQQQRLTDEKVEFAAVERKLDNLSNEIKNFKAEDALADVKQVSKAHIEKVLSQKTLIDEPRVKATI